MTQKKTIPGDQDNNPLSSETPEFADGLDSDVQAALQNSMRLEWRDPRTLAAHALNWKNHPSLQREAFAELIEDVGWAGAALYNERTKTLLDGHLRLEHCLENNEPVIPTLVIDVDPDKELRILEFLDIVGSLFQRQQSRLDTLTQLSNSRSELLKSLVKDRQQPEAEETAQQQEGFENWESFSKPLPEAGVSLVPGEAYNYVTLIFKTELDWTNAQDHFNLREVKCVFSSGVGIGRVVDGGEYLRRIRLENIGRRVKRNDTDES